MTEKPARTSFFKALVSKKARDRRRFEIQLEKEEEEQKKVLRAKVEGTVLSVFLIIIGMGLSLVEGRGLLCVLIIIGAFPFWKLMCAFAYHLGPIFGGKPRTVYRSKKQSVFHGPRGGRYRMSADGKSRIYF